MLFQHIFCTLGLKMNLMDHSTWSNKNMIFVLLGYVLSSDLYFAALVHFLTILNMHFLASTTPTDLQSRALGF